MQSHRIGLISRFVFDRRQRKLEESQGRARRPAAETNVRQTNMKLNVLPRLVLILSLGVATIACGYFMAGTWEDDPKNWYRAFGEETPPEVTLKHSLYTRYPHFTHEHSFYLEFEAQREFLDKMIAKFSLRRATEPRSRRELLGNLSGIPYWFLPEPTEHVEVWIGTGALEGAQMFIDEGRGVAYFTHVQL